MKRSERAFQARRELDRKFREANLKPIHARPRSGWIRAIRSGLGMSQEALAARLGVAAPTVTKLEKSELNETISVGKLAEIARALDCTLVYALVPNDSLEHTVQSEARRVSAKLLGYVATTMRLEDQAVSSDQQADQIQRQAQQIIESNRLWGRD
ncbi:MAG TPA: mobile mystery protein A [Acidimicrobiales bacterium]